MKRKYKEDFNYIDNISLWLREAKAFEDDINLKELSRLSGKEIKKKLKAKRDPTGRILMKSYNTPFELWFYYNNPKEYYETVFGLIKTIRSVIHNEFYTKSITYMYPGDPTPHFMSLIHFTFNMIMWLPLFILDVDITKDLTFMPRVFNNTTYVKFINEKIIEPHKHLVTHNEMSKMLAKIYDLFIIICEKYGLDLGLSFSLHSLISKWDNEEIYDLNHTKIPKHMQISDTEDYLNSRLNRYIEIMTNDPDDNVIKPLWRSGAGINKKQLREFTISVGYRPDINGYTIPYAPSSCFVSYGLRNPVDFCIDAAGGRKASILALEIDNSGYLARTFSKSASNIYLNKDITYDCGSENYYERLIKDKYDLDDMYGRWYLSEDGKSLKQLSNKDFDLIGKTLKFRTPVTCASKDGICAICYGHLYTQNMYINAGINSTLKVSESTYQQTMSAKQLAG